MESDALLIEQSIATQYGVLPAAQEDLSWQDWSKLVAGLMDNTPLGRVVAVRSEQNKDVIKNFSPWQQKIHAEWKSHQAKQMLERKSEKELRAEMQQLEKMLAQAFGGGS